MIVYKYILSIDGASPSIVTPIRDNTPTFDSKLVDGEVFHREELQGGQMLFANKDFDIIFNAPFESKFTIDKAIQNEFGGFETRFVGVFYRTDCEIDEDESIIEVKIDPEDNYKLVMESLDKEFDLLELGVAKFEFDYRKEPVFQLLMVEDSVTVQSVLTNIVGGVAYEESLLVVPGGGGDLVLNYVFGQIGNIGVVTGEVGMNPDISGEYLSGVGGWRRISDDRYVITLDAPQDTESDLIVTDTISTAVVYRATKPLSGKRYDDWILVGAVSGSTAKFINRDIYGRYLTNEDTVLGLPTQDIPESDVATNPAGYTKCIPVGNNLLSGEIQVDPLDVLAPSNRHQVDPTAYVRIPTDADFFPGEYLLEPNGYVAGEYQPIAESTWGEASFWFKYDSILRGVQETGSETITERNGHLLSDALQAVLTAIGSDLVYAANTDHSDFFFNPLNTIRGSDRKVIIVPKSNIIQGEYENPARYAPVKLQQLIDLYKGAYKVKWHIDHPKFITEHEEYYHRGMSYTVNNVGTDLTELKEPKTGLNWDYKSNKWGYAKDKMPEQFRFYWMDDVSKPFRGFQINVNSQFVQKGNIKEVRIDSFTSDIAILQLLPNDVTRKGFFVGEVELVSGRYVLPIDLISPGNAGSYKIQNPYMSMIYLHDKYHKYTLPASNVNINAEDTTALSVTRTRIQKLDLPSGLVSKDNVMSMIKTNLGEGLVTEVVDNVDGSGSKVIIRHDLDII